MERETRTRLRKGISALVLSAASIFAAERAYNYSGGLVNRIATNQAEVRERYESNPQVRDYLQAQGQLQASKTILYSIGVNKIDTGVYVDSEKAKQDALNERRAIERSKQTYFQNSIDVLKANEEVVCYKREMNQASDVGSLLLIAGSCIITPAGALAGGVSAVYALLHLGSAAGSFIYDRRRRRSQTPESLKR